MVLFRLNTTPIH